MGNMTGFFARYNLKKPQRIVGLIIFAILILVHPARSQNLLTPSQSSQKPTAATIGPGFDSNHIQVKFKDQLDVTLGPGNIPITRTSGILVFTSGASRLLTAMTFAGGKWKRTMGASEEILDSMRAKAQITLGREIADLNNYFILTVPESIRAEDWINRLNSLPEVELAWPLPLPAPVPVPPDFQSLQGYLNPAAQGIDAYYAWLQPGGTGTNVTICDLEYSWNLNHQDLPAGIPTWLPPGHTAGDPFNSNHHGTAVLGEIVSLNNGWGTTGAAYGAAVAVAPVSLNDGSGEFWRLATALSNVITNLSAGDVILIEQQTYGPNWSGSGQFGLVPVEWEQPIYNAIVTAVGNGIHVVEAAGNGTQNLDDPVYSTENGGHWPFLPANNSGAIIVGGGNVGGAGDLSRISYSNYGSRVNLQGWAENVMTTGYGSYYSSEGFNLYYTSGFGGTSSASPMVASAVALLESIYEQANGTEMTPADLRALLIATGTLQTSGGHIGPRPNLQSALLGCVALPGDANASWTYSLVDVISIVNFVFNKAGCSPLPTCWLSNLECRGDWNASGSVTLVDVIQAVNFLFNRPGGPWNASPIGACCQSLP
jgi:hypothetical protein